MDDQDAKILLEQIREQNDVLIEGQSALNLQLQKFARQADLLEVKQDTKVIKKVVIATNKDLRAMDERVKQLEAAS